MKRDVVGIILLSSLFILLIVAGIISYQSIDWTVLNRLENQKIILPTPNPTTPSVTK